MSRGAAELLAEAVVSSEAHHQSRGSTDVSVLDSRSRGPLPKEAHYMAAASSERERAGESPGQ